MCLRDVFHDSFICGVWLIYICDTWICFMRCMTHLHTWCMTHFLFFMWDKSHWFRWGSFRYGKCLVHEFDMHNLYLWHDAFMCVTWDWYAGNTFISGTWLILVSGIESRVFISWNSNSRDCRIYEWKSVHTILLTTTSTTMTESKCLFIGTFCIIKVKSAGNEATQDHQMQKCR